jgi:L-asparaginase
MKKLLTLFMILFLFIQANAQLPKVIILATGGTIAGAGAASDRAGYTAGKIPIDDLIGAIPPLKRSPTITGEQISSVGSQDMTIEIWKKLGYPNQRDHCKKRSGCHCCYTWHRTHQEETAYFLDLVVPSQMPVVLTGSMRPATAISADGPKKLI